MINEHDMTKSMIDKMKSTLLREFVNQPQNQDPGYTETDVEAIEPKTEIKEISFLDDNGNLRPDVPENMKVYWDGTESEKKKFEKNDSISCDLGLRYPLLQSIFAGHKNHQTLHVS